MKVVLFFTVIVTAIYSAQACLRNNWDYWGADIPGKNFKVQGGVNACIRECRRTAGCKSLAFRPTDGQCWLKNKENGARSKPQSNRQSINMSCAEPKPSCIRNNWDYWGADIRGKNFRVKGGIHTCIYHCKITKGCKSLAFRPTDGQCWLKHTRNGARSKPQSNRQSVNMVCTESKPSSTSTSGSKPAGPFKPVAKFGYQITAANGPAAGHSLTAKNDRRNGHSFWAHTEKTSDQCSKWEIIEKTHRGKKCFNIKSTCSLNKGMMLVVHSDNKSNGDARAVVHKTPHKPEDECWDIETVNVRGAVAYRLKKNQGRSNGKYLVSRVKRNGSSFWVDVTKAASAATLWNIGVSKATPTQVTVSYSTKTCRSKGSEFKPAAKFGYRVTALNGAAAGHSMTAKNDRRNGHSFWAHTEKTSDQCSKWEIIKKTHRGKKCYNVKSTCSLNKGMMLVVHSDNKSNGDARAVVHKTPHKPEDECWDIEAVCCSGVVAYKLKKNQGRSNGKYLVSRVKRNGSSFWVDVTKDASAATLWSIGDSKSRC